MVKNLSINTAFTDIDSMRKSEIRILVVDDDPSVGKAFTEALSRAGYATRLEGTYGKAKQAVKLTDFQAFVIDCMLPQKSGIDLATELLTEVSPDTPIVLTSGIFKDKSFAADAIRRTGAIAFLNKPVDLEELISVIDDAFKEQLGQERPELYQTLIKSQISPVEKLNAIQQTRFIHGYDIPLLISTLIETPISGNLNLKYEDGTEANIEISEGRLANLIYKDTESYFGVLLIEMGFTTAEELEEGLSQTQLKPIGQRLVDSSALSPHAVQIVHHQQMIIRLSKLIKDTSLEIEFTEKVIPEPESFIDGIEFAQLLNDWIQTKLPAEWLNSFYTTWLEHPLIKGADFAKFSMIKNLPILMPVAHLSFEKYNGTNLVDVIGQNSNIENDLIKAIHFLMLMKIFNFAAEREETKNISMKIDRLKKIWSEMKNQDYFAVLGVSKNARPAEISRSFHELAKTMHPDKLPSSATTEMKELTQMIYTKISDAYQTLNNDTKRAHYKKTLQIGAAEEILKAESAFEEALKLLQTNRYREARKAFERTIKMRGHRSDTIIYLTWSLLKEKRNKTDHDKLTHYVSSLISQVPHEDRHSIPYFFAKGMLYEISGQVHKAQHSFKHCLALDPNFLDARRELAFIKEKYGKMKASSFSDDLSVVVTKFFGRK
jgi:CheY-like chemotaxis protein/curved DNA-binding protein CbpA